MTEKLTSLDDLEVGQLVSFTDDLDPERNGTFRVAFIDYPEAILKNTDGGWPRIAWMVKDFGSESYRITLIPEDER
jgi:hypothetical protein